jgi:hypothetical protein
MSALQREEKPCPLAPPARSRSTTPARRKEVERIRKTIGTPPGKRKGGVGIAKAIVGEAEKYQKGPKRG